jgi:hypothetical protein
VTKGEGLTEAWREMHNDVHNKPFSSLNTVTDIKLKRWDVSASNEKHRAEKHIKKIYFKILTRGDNSVDLGVSGNAVLKWTSYKYCVRLCKEFNPLKTKLICFI